MAGRRAGWLDKQASISSAMCCGQSSSILRRAGRQTGGQAGSADQCRLAAAWLVAPDFGVPQASGSPNVDVTSEIAAAHCLASHNLEHYQAQAENVCRGAAAFVFCFLFLHCLTSGLWSITEPSPDAPATKGRRLAFVVDRALAAELLSALA